MQNVTSPAAATLCPLCGKANQCAMEIEQATGVKQAPCWCTRVDFIGELLQQVPEESQGTACICATCQEASIFAFRKPALP
jgi:hypothetical protein